MWQISISMYSSSLTHHLNVNDTTELVKFTFGSKAIRWELVKDFRIQAICWTPNSVEVWLHFDVILQKRENKLMAKSKMIQHTNTIRDIVVTGYIVRACMPTYRAVSVNLYCHGIKITKKEFSWTTIFNIQCSWVSCVISADRL